MPPSGPLLTPAESWALSNSQMNWQGVKDGKCSDWWQTVFKVIKSTTLTTQLHYSFIKIVVSEDSPRFNTSHTHSPNPPCNLWRSAAVHSRGTSGLKRTLKQSHKSWTQSKLNMQSWFLHTVEEGLIVPMHLNIVHDWTASHCIAERSWTGLDAEILPTKMYATDNEGNNTEQDSRPNKNSTGWRVQTIKDVDMVHSIIPLPIKQSGHKERKRDKKRWKKSSV